MFPSSCSPSSSGSGSSSCLAAIRTSAEIISRKLRVWVPHPREIRRPRARADIVEDEVVPAVLVQARDFRSLVVQVTERKGVGGARLLACRHQISVVDPSVPGPCVDGARSIRCTQYVHFSMTPRLRTVTSGFMRIFSTSPTSYV